MNATLNGSTGFKLGMRRLVAGVCLITTADRDEWFGTIATAVSSVTADPPTLLVCINRSNSIHAPLGRSGVFCVNVLDAEQEHISRIFSSPDARDKRFAQGQWIKRDSGVPILSNASASFECTATQLIDYCTHTIVLGEVSAVQTSSSANPLAYYDGNYRSFGGQLPAR